MPVVAWGFPAGAESLQVEEGLLITDVTPDFFVLNKPLDPGFSGGPVVDGRGALVGVISRASKKQTRCVTSPKTEAFVRDRRNRLIP